MSVEIVFCLNKCKNMLCVDHVWESTMFSATFVRRTDTAPRPVPTDPARASILANFSRAGFGVSRCEFVEAGPATYDFTGSTGLRNTLVQQ